MNFVWIGAAVICLTIAAAQEAEDEVSKGMACLAQKALEQKNKEIVKTIVLEVFNDHDFSNIDKYIHPDVVDHNVNVVNGVEAFKEWSADYANKTEKGQIKIYRISAEGDLVWNHLKIPNPEGGSDLAIIEIFRLRDGKLDEHWDVTQPMGDLNKSKNPHPFF